MWREGRGEAGLNGGVFTSFGICTLAKVMEDLFCRRFLLQLEGKVDKYQFARKGMSTTDALISFLQPIFEA